MLTLTNVSGNSSGPAGKVVNGSGNISHALVAISEYNNSYNNIQAGLTELLATLSKASAKLAHDFQLFENSPGGALYEMENKTASQFPGDSGQQQSEYSAWMSQTQSEYQAQSAANSAQIKSIDTESSEDQNVMSQLPQQSQNNIQLMGTIVSWTQNIAKLLSN